MLTERQQKLLKLLVEAHIRKPEPVASAFLAGKLAGRVSSATVRNELAALENAGYIRQPHTSAGRVPTAQAYEFFVAEHLTLPSTVFPEALLAAVRSLSDFRSRVKFFAKAVAEKSQLIAFVAWSPDDTYYTGLSNLFAQPEFRDHAAVLSVSEFIDRLDLALVSRWEDEAPERILIGESSGLDADCGLLMTRLSGGEGDSLFGLLGPMRMDYNLNVALLRGVATFFQNNK